MSKFGPLPSQIQWEDELRACYTEMPNSLRDKDPHLFVRESIQIRILRINAIITGFEKSLSLYKEKLRIPIKDPYHDPDVFLPDYGATDDDEPSLPDGYMH